MPEHNHTLCTTRAKTASTVVNILSKWHFDFPREHAIVIVKQHYECFHNRGTQSALTTAQDIIAAVADEASLDNLLADLYQYVEDKQALGSTDSSYDPADSELLARIVKARQQFAD